MRSLTHFSCNTTSRHACVCVCAILVPISSEMVFTVCEMTALVVRRPSRKRKEKLRGKGVRKRAKKGG